MSHAHKGVIIESLQPSKSHVQCFRVCGGSSARVGGVLIAVWMHRVPAVVLFGLCMARDYEPRSGTYDSEDRSHTTTINARLRKSDTEIGRMMLWPSCFLTYVREANFEC